MGGPWGYLAKRSTLDWEIQILYDLTVFPHLVSHVQLCDLMECKPPGSSVPGILQASILEWVAISFSSGSSWPRDWTGISCIPCIDRGVLYHWATWEAPRILEWVAFPFPRVSSQRRDESRSPTLQADSLPAEPPGKPKSNGVGSLSLLQQISLTQE